MIITSKHPAHDTVLFDGECRFCQRQIAILRALDVQRRFIYTSLHESSVSIDFPELSSKQLQEQMFVIDTQGNARGGAVAVRYLSRKLPLLWPLSSSFAYSRNTTTLELALCIRRKATTLDRWQM